MTPKRFVGLYQAYKDTFDLELMLDKKGWTYAYLEKKQMADEEWFD